MNFKLENFFIGVVDLFAIILPGSVMTFFLQGQFEDILFLKSKIFPQIPKDYKWIVFLIIAYITGHIINAIGAKLFDEMCYDRGMWKLYARNFDLTYITASDIKDKYLNNTELKKYFFNRNVKLRDNYISYLRKKEKGFKDTKNAKSPNLLADGFINDKKIEIINTFKWARRFLTLNKPDVLEEVNRLEADQKFFRSLTVVFLMIGLWLIAEIVIKINILTLAISAASVFLAVLCIWRYGKLRFKTMEVCYQYVIAAYYNDEKKIKRNK